MPRIGQAARTSTLPAQTPHGQSLAPSATDPWPELRPLGDFDSPIPFPVDTVFPPQMQWMRDYIAAVAESAQVPAELPALLLLPVASVGLANKFDIHLHGDWAEPSALWTLTLLNSGERKSAVLSELLAPIKHWERDAAEDSGGHRTRAAVTLSSIKGQIKSLMTKIEAGSGTAEDEDKVVALEARRVDLEASLVVPRVYADEATTEAMASIMLTNGERLLVAASEADALDVMLGRYSRTPNMGVWLKGHAGETINIDRQARHQKIMRPCLSLAMTVQRQSIGELYSSPQARDRGFLARILPACPASRLGSRSLKPPPVPPDLRELYASTITRMLDTPIPTSAGGRRSKAHLVTLDRDADDAFTSFRAMVESEIGEGGQLSYDTAWASKLPGQLARIALTLHGLTQFSAPGHFDSVLRGPTMRAALSLAEYFMVQNQLVNAQTVVSGDETMARKIAGWIKRKRLPRFSRRECHTANRDKGDFQKAEAFDGPLGLLLAHNIIRLIDGPDDDRQRGRPTEHYAVHPELIEARPATTYDPLPDDPNGRSDDE